MAVDIVDKIAKLLSLAESPNENEAKAAMLKARKLMAENKLRPEDIRSAETQKLMHETIGVTFTRTMDPWKEYLATVIGNAYCCQGYMYCEKGKRIHEVGFIGLEDDFQICKKIYTYAVSCVESKLADIAFSMRQCHTAIEIRNAQKAYGVGFVKGLTAAYQAQNREHQEYGLVLVKPREVLEDAGMLNKPDNWKYSEEKNDANKKARAQGVRDGYNFHPETRIQQKDDSSTFLLG